MKRIPRCSSFPQTIKVVSLVLSYALIVATVFTPVSKADSSATHPAALAGSWSPTVLLSYPTQAFGFLLALFQGGGLPSVPGPNLPDLDAARQVVFAEPVAPAAIASNQACSDCTPCPTCGPGTSNHAPVVNAGGPYYGSAGTGMVLNGLKSFDVDAGDGISNYSWSFGDNTAAVTEPVPTHTYQSSGNYTISLTVTDSHSTTATTSTTAAITAAPPAVPPSGATPGNSALFISQSAPTTMTAGETYPVAVTMRNTGTTTWTAAHLYRLGSQGPQDNNTWGRARVFLPGPVAPGANVVFNFTVVAPYGGMEDTAPAHFQWRLVEDGVEWFGAATSNQTVTIQSNYQPPPGDGAPGTNPRSDLFNARLAPQNRLGNSGDDLLSRNFNWGTSLVSLPGRAGLNLSLGLSYNSLAAWTKTVTTTSNHGWGFTTNTSFTFDADLGSPAPGFQLGFPTIEGPYYNDQAAAGAYLMIMPSGARVELRQVGATNVYEAVDSSYLQLVEGTNGSLVVRATDGSQWAYWSINARYRCTEIKDRNGNYITIKHDPLNGVANLGRITSIIDTLGRTINFNYDSNYRLLTITQLRNGQTHVWASFGYADLPIETNFITEDESEVAVLGLPDNNIVSVVTQVGLDDGSKYQFDYSSWGQIYRIHHYAADGHELNYSKYNLPVSSSLPELDCPRFSERRDFAENWNGGAEAVTQYAFESGLPAEALVNGRRVRLFAGDSAAWSQAVSPDGAIYREYSNAEYTDYRRGLVTRTEIYSADNTSVPKKTTITDWTQDVTSVPYPLNPRPTATTISDSDGNRNRTTMEYTAFGLPADVYEWGPYGTTEWRTLRRTHTEYNLAEAYVNRRIIGLVAGQYLFAPDAPDSYSIQTLLSKATQEYDIDIGFCGSQNCLNGSGQEQQSTDYATAASGGGSNFAIQHDANYGQSFVVGRGALTRVSRWDVEHETGGGQLTSTLQYDTLGSLVAASDPAGHRTVISYADSFSSDGTAVNSFPFVTLAYPTSVTDPDGFSSSVKYNYELGVVTRQVDPKGAAQTTEYDAAARVKKVTNVVNGAYTRIVYPASQTIVNKFTTIQAGQGEAYAATIIDGAGRVRAQAKDFPNSTGRYSGQFMGYNVTGQAVIQTNPTEMSNLWTAAGDDGPGWHAISQTYDWKGRALIRTNQDGTTKELSYAGCGCAGGEVVTLTDEGTTVGAGASAVAKKRQQKIYSDPLGRTVKTEVLNWDGPGPFGAGGSVYSSVVNTFNARDQVTRTRQYQGASGVHQDTTMGRCEDGT